MITPWDTIYKNYAQGGEAWATLGEEIHPLFPPFIERSVFPRKHALDIGCGTGKYLKFLHEDGFEVEGIDTSETALKMTHDALPEATLEMADMYTYTIPSDRFDLILSVSTIHHGTKKQVASVVRNIHAALIDGGHMFITIPSWDDAREEKMRSDHDMLGPGTLAPRTGPEKGLAHSFYTEAEVRTLFGDFRNLSLELDVYKRWVVTGVKELAAIASPL